MDNDSNPTDSVTHPDTKFTSQAQILQKLDKKDKGLCSPFANLFAEYKMGLRGHEFLEQDPQTTYDMAKDMEAYQQEVRQALAPRNGSELAALIAMNVAFFDKGILFKADKRPITMMTDPVKLKAELDGVEHALIDFPTKESTQQNVDSYHQVYIGRDRGTKRCSFFDANIDGGEREGDCNDIMTLLAQQIQKSSNDTDRRPVMVVKSMPT